MKDTPTSYFSVLTVKKKQLQTIPKHLRVTENFRFYNTEGNLLNQFTFPEIAENSARKNL